MGKKAERIRKENKNLSGDGEGGEGGGESKVQNSPKAFGELKSVLSSQGYTIKVPSSANCKISCNIV